MPIFGKFDPKAKQVLDASQQAAISLRHRFWGTEHLLIGLLSRAAGELPGLPGNLTLTFLISAALAGLVILVVSLVLREEKQTAAN